MIAKVRRVATSRTRSGEKAGFVHRFGAAATGDGPAPRRTKAKAAGRERRAAWSLRLYAPPPPGRGSPAPERDGRGRSPRSALAARLVQRRRDARVAQVFAQVLDVLPAERVGVVGPMQDALGAVQLHADARAGQRLDVGAEVVQQRFDFPPLDVAADGVGKMARIRFSCLWLMAAGDRRGRRVEPGFQTEFYAFAPGSAARARCVASRWREGGQRAADGDVRRRCDVDSLLSLAGSPAPQARRSIASAVGDRPPEMKKPCYVYQPVGIGDILFIQKLVRHYADSGHRVVCPILDRFEWLLPTLAYPGVSYPLIRGDRSRPSTTARSSSRSPSAPTRIWGIRLLASRRDPALPVPSAWAEPPPVWRSPRHALQVRALRARLLGLGRLRDARAQSRAGASAVRGARPSRRHPLHAGQRALQRRAAADGGARALRRMEYVEGFGLLDWLLVAERAARIVTIDTFARPARGDPQARAAAVHDLPLSAAAFRRDEGNPASPVNYVPTPADLVLDPIE